MTAIITEKLRTFNATQFINSFNQLTYNSWVTGTAYLIGDIVFDGFYKYIAITSGTSGGTPPSHISGSASDGGVTWLYVETYLNQSFYNNNLYIAMGRKEPWTDDNAPDAPIDSVTEQLPRLHNIISAKRLTNGNAKLGIVRNDWLSGTIYNKFDPEIESFNYSAVNGGTPFYVYQDDGGDLNIYKCLDNNGDIPSTSAPTGQSVNAVITADGYVWKYMGSVQASDALSFLTTTYLPVELRLGATDTTTQGLVQQNAKVNSLSRINVSDGGAGYTVAPTISFSVEGETVAAIGVAIVAGGEVTAISLTNIGTGYDVAPTITITPDAGDTITVPAVAESIMAPKDGHGANILEELNARYVIIASRFEDDEGGYFPTDDDFREVFITVDLKDENGDFASQLRYIGPDHPDYVLNPGSLEKLDDNAGSVLYTESIVPVVRQPGQIEDLKIVVKM